MVKRENDGARSRSDKDGRYDVLKRNGQQYEGDAKSKSDTKG